MTAEETLIDHYGCKDLADLQAYLGEFISITMITEAMELFGKHEYNRAVRDAAENAKCKSINEKIQGMICGLPMSTTHQIRFIVDPESILKLIKS